MSTLARLVVKLVTDVTEFTSGMEKASQKLGMMGQTMQSAGDKMTLGITLPIVAAGVAAVKFASDLEETRNKTEVVFGDMSQAVFDFADNSASAMGMSENAALSAASTFGNLFTSMGIGKSAAADMSTGLVALAADLASFNNLKPEEVFLKLQSGIVGEIEPMRALGVNLSAVAVEAKAMQMGLVDANGELSEQAKIMARYAIIMEQTKNAQGDFARTSDGLANSTRILKAQLEDTLASFGEELIPAVTAALKALTPILEWFNKLPDSAKQGIIYLLLFAAAMGPILSIGGRLLQLFSLLGGALGSGGALASAAAWITGTLGPALAGIGVAIKAAFTGVAALIGGISLPVLALIAAIAALIVVLIKFGPTAWKTVTMLWTIFRSILQRIKYEIDKFAANMIAWVRTKFGAVGANIVTGIWEGIKRAWPLLTGNLPLFLANLLRTSQTQIGAQSPSKVWAEKIGLPMAQGVGVGFAQGMGAVAPGFGAALQPSYAMTPSAEGVRSGSTSREITVGPITIYGDLSKSAKERLREEMHVLITETFMDALS